MSVSIDTSQIEQLGRSLGASSGRVGARVARVFRKTAYDIEGDAKILSPVDTGALENSISTTITGDGRTGSISAEIGPTVEYGIYQEFGTSEQSGQPYLGPAFDRRLPAFEAAVAQAAAQDL